MARTVGEGGHQNIEQMLFGNKQNPVSLVESMRKQGKSPTPQQVEAALRYLDENTDKPSFNSATAYGNAFGSNNALNEQNANDIRRQQARMNPDDMVWRNAITNQPAAPAAAPKATRPLALNELPGIGLMDSLQKLVGMASDRINASGINQPESYTDIYNRLMQQQPQYTGPSAEQMAQNEFGPQFEILKQAAAQQQSRYNEGNAGVKAAYAALVNDSNKARGENAAMYKQAGQDISKNYAEASGNISEGVTNSVNSMAEELSRMGILEGVGDLAKDSQANLATQLGRLGQQQQISSDLNTQFASNQYGADTDLSGIRRQQGVERQGDLYDNFIQQMNENDMMKLNLQSQQSQAQNNYAMQIQNMLAGQQEQQQQSAMDYINMLMQERAAQSENEFRQANLRLDQDRFGLETDKFNASRDSNQQMNPYQQLQSAALDMTGDPEKARQAADIIFQAYIENPNAQNAAQLLEALGYDTLRSAPYMQDLAFGFFNQVAPKR